MLIGLISDTHIRIPGYRAGLSQLWASELPPQVTDAFKGVDLILHAGDIYTIPILDQLEKVAPVIAAEGDDDPFETANDPRVKWRHVLQYEGVTLWLAHQPEVWYWDDHEKPPGVIIFGHSHESLLQRDNGVLRFNPGSAIFPKYKHVLGSVGLLKVESGKVVDAGLVQLKGEIGGTTGATLRRGNID